LGSAGGPHGGIFHRVEAKVGQAFQPDGAGPSSDESLAKPTANTFLPQQFYWLATNGAEECPALSGWKT
jgi:hypothetical protein